MITRTIFLSFIAAGPLACSDPGLEPATLSDVCGEASPIRALALEPGQDLQYTQHIGDRLYHGIGRVAPDKTGPERFTDLELWSTDPCGGSPIHVADNILYLETLERWPGVLLGCDENLGLVSLDPAGQEPPHPVVAACLRDQTDHGYIGFEHHDDDTSTLLLYPYPDDPRTQTSEPIVLLDTIVDPGKAAITADAVHTLLAGGELVRVDLATQDITPVQTNVRSFAVSADQRYLLWQDATPVGGNPDNPDGVVSLRDNTTGTSLALGNSGTVSRFNLYWADQGYLVLGNYGARIYTLPDLTFIELPYGSLNSEGPLPDRRWVVEDITGQGPWLSALDLADGTISPLFSQLAHYRGHQHGYLVVLDTTGDQGPLWGIPIDGGPTRKFAERATLGAAFIDPGRILNHVDIDADDLRTLVIVDADTLAEHRIDDHVSTTRRVFTPSSDATLLAYSVHDGDRSGVWLAYLPPAP